MLRGLAKVVRRRPRAAALLLALLVAAGMAAGGYGYLLYRWRLAQTAVREGRPADARDDLKVCLLVWPRSPAVHLLAARAARLGGDFETAEAHLKQCMRLQNGASEGTKLEFLLMRVQTGEVDEVEQELLACVNNDHPESALILETLAAAYLRHLRYGPALNCLNRWAQAEPDSATPRYWRGWVLERLNDTKGAMREYYKALELDPDLVRARLRVAEILLGESNPPEALPHLERLLRQCPDSADVRARLGECRFLQGQFEEARRLLESAVEEMPNDPSLLIHLAKLDMHFEQPARAEQRLRRVLKADPADTEAQYTLISCLKLQNRRQEAEAVLARYKKNQALLKQVTQLLRDEADHPTIDPDRQARIGSLFLDVGQERLGEYWLHKALARDPKHQAAHRALAAYYEKNGQREKAASHRRLAGPDKKPE